jgi:hypothetical protein
MELAPYYGEQPLTVSNIVVRVSGADRKRVNEVVMRSKQEIVAVKDDDAFMQARRVAGELKATEKEIQDSKRAAKRPFEAIINALDELAKEVASPVVVEQHRVLDLIAGYVRQLEQKQKEELARQQALRDAEEQAHQAKLREMQLAREAAERRAREAEDELARAKAKAEADAQRQKLADAQQMRDLELEVRAMNMEPVKGLVPGGRVSHPFKFKLLDAEKAVAAGLVRLLRIELNIPNCQDAVKSQLERNPDAQPVLPGIEISQEISVAIKPSSRIR